MIDDQLRFRVEDHKESTLLSTVIKVLIIFVLLLLTVVVGIWGYKMLKEDKKAVVVQKRVTPAQTHHRSIDKKELAIIIRAVIEQMQKEQQKSQKVTSASKANKAKISSDRELLNSLQNVKVDTIKEQKPKKIANKAKQKKEIKKLANKKITKKIIKKKIVYNAVIIGKREIKSTSDLAKLYASINKISRKKKKKILKSAYTKKITKEIIIRKNSMRTIRVRKGDTLSSIAKRAYGNPSLYNKIFEANPDLLSDPNNLRVGQILRVPK